MTYEPTKPIKEVAEALAYSLKYNCRNNTDTINIVSDFWNSVNRKNLIRADEVELLIHLTHDTMGRIPR